MDTRITKLDARKPALREIKEAARTIDNGGLVVFPTETVYGIACRVALDPLAKLTLLKERAAEKHYTLHIGPKLDVYKYVPAISPVGRQLIKKGWPGPLTIVFELSNAELAEQRSLLGENICDIIYKDNTIGIRCPDNVIASLLLSHTEHPVVAPSANLGGRPPATDGTAALAQLDGRVDMILDGGACKYGLASTVVKIDASGVNILRQGIYDRRDIEAMSAFNILFVCTGNTCRSPMATGLCRKYLAQKLHCDIDRLDKIGYKTTSVGTMGMSGWPASPEAIEVCKAKGVDISGHRSSALSAVRIRQSDVIYVMCRQHRESVLELCPDVGDKCFLLATNEEIPDPIGRSEKDYYYCAELIEKAIEKRISELIK
jgi:tRNA threonylcarbamoyl adenosine modification protein (Sua5/YciO/YrdC/YwlC family)